MEQHELSSRKRVFYFAIGALFAMYLGRLTQLQILYQDVYGKKSEENSIRPIAREPIRGYIFDRKGKIVVDNRPSYTVTVTPAEFRESGLPYLAKILQLDPEFIQERIRKGKVYNRFPP